MMTKVEEVARALCKADRHDPDALERSIYLTPAQRLEAQKSLNKTRRKMLDRLRRNP